MKIILCKETGRYFAHVNTRIGKRKFDLNTDNLEMAESIAKVSGIEEMEMNSARIAGLAGDVALMISTGHNISVQQAAKLYLEYVDKKFSMNTAKNYRLSISKFVEAFGEKRMASDVCEEEIETFVNTMDCKRWTRIAYLARIKAMFSWLTDKGYIVVNPAKTSRVTTEGLSHEQKMTTERQVFTPEQSEAVISFLKSKMTKLWQKMVSRPEPWWRQSIEPKFDRARFLYLSCRLMQQTGLRFCDTLSLEWACLEGNNLIVVTRKTDTVVHHELSADLIQEIRSIPVTGERVFDSIDGDSISERNLLSFIDYAIRKIVGKGYSAHSFRHTKAVTMQQEAGANIQQIAAALGHRDTDTTMRYLSHQITGHSKGALG